MAEPFLPMDPNIKLSCNYPLTKKEIRGLNLYGNVKSLKEAMKQLFRQKDLDDFTNRMKWYDIPLDLKSTDIERLLYYKGSLAFWYFKELDKFMLTPYALIDGLDAYGRYKYVRPIPFAADDDAKKNKSYVALESLMSTKKLKVIYDVQLEEDFVTENGEFLVDEAEDLLNNSAVILYDRTTSLMAKNVVGRSIMQEGLLDVMAECVPFARTALENSTGIQGIRVSSEDESSNVIAANNTFQMAALTGEKYVPIVGNIEFQDLTAASGIKSAEFMELLQSFNNLRLSMYGLDNSGMIEKKAYVNELATSMNNVGLSLQDALNNRQDFCAIVNSIWDCNMWCEISQTASGMDVNGDGLPYDSESFQAPEDQQGGNEDVE